MNNEQKAENYAAQILESNHTSCWGLVEWHDALTEAVIHGIKLGQDEVDANMRKEMAKGFILTLTEDGFEYIKRQDLDI